MTCAPSPQSRECGVPGSAPRPAALTLGLVRCGARCESPPGPLTCWLFPGTPMTYVSTAARGRQPRCTISCGRSGFPPPASSMRLVGTMSAARRPSAMSCVTCSWLPVSAADRPRRLIGWRRRREAMELVSERPGIYLRCAGSYRGAQDTGKLAFGERTGSCRRGGLRHGQRSCSGQEQVSAQSAYHHSLERETGELFALVKGYLLRAEKQASKRAVPVPSASPSARGR